MVSSIVPGATAGANALGVDTRLTRAQTPQPQRNDDAAMRGDRVEISTPASWSAARESVRAGLTQVHEALAAGHDAQSMLVQVQALARDEGAQADLDTLLQSYSSRMDALTARGGVLAAGEDIAVQAEPDAPAVSVRGADLRLKAEPGEGDVLAVPRNASVDDPNLAQAAQRSLDALQGVMERFFDAARALEAHQGFLGAAEGANAANADLDADGARLLALQVRQGLANAGAIANVEPQAVLALFKV